MQVIIFCPTFVCFQGETDSLAIKMEFDEEFGGAAAEGGGDDSLNTSATATKTPKLKREKKEPGKIIE